MVAHVVDDLRHESDGVAVGERGFADVCEGDWEAAAEAALRGRSLSSLVTTLAGGVETLPLYTPHRHGTEADPAGLPGEAPYARGAAASSGGQGWEVRQLHDIGLAATPDAIAVDTTSGVDAVVVARGWNAERDAVLLDAAVGDAAEAGVTIHLQAGTSLAHAEALLEILSRRGVDPARTRSWLGIDPVAAAAVGAAGGQTAPREPGEGEPADGEVGDSKPVAGEIGVNELAGQMADAAVRAGEIKKQWPQVVPLEADGSVFADAGATDVTEMAAMLATGTAWLRAARGTAWLRADCGADAGPRLAPTAAAQMLGFTTSAGPDPFVVTAKCRALRMCWARILGACAVDLGGPDGLLMPLAAVTSAAMTTERDPWVNMLRTTAACFGAANGGVDAITVRPYDIARAYDAGRAYDAATTGAASSALGWRVAANTQLILRHESRIGSVIDPGGGSWYLESLTRSMAQAAWAGFRRIEAAGGICVALASGELAALIAQERTQRHDQIAAGDRVIVGVTQFADSRNAQTAADTSATRTSTTPNRVDRSPRNDARSDQDTGKFGLGVHRWAAPFETETYAQAQ